MRSLYTWFTSGLLSVILLLAGGGPALASFVIQSQVTAPVEIKGYNGLAGTSLFKEILIAGEPQKIDTAYQGIALLVFKTGQQYPLILGEQSFVLKIAGPDHPPSFSGSPQNVFFYNLLAGKETGTGRFAFPLLMLKAKELLKESSSTKTMADLVAMKERFHVFVDSHYQDLQHSDMLRRLLGQYFMMHEYVDYHVEGAPAGDIRVQYQKAVLNGVKNWLRILKPHLPENEVLNYCVSLYYDRSMVTLAHLIVSNFSDYAYCGGTSRENFRLPEDLSVIDGEKNNQGKIKNFSMNGVATLVSDDCPISMVETVIKARELAKQGKGAKLIVVPVQQLSKKHLAMHRMLVGDNMLFVGDEQWRKENLPENVRLPLYIDLAASHL